MYGCIFCNVSFSKPQYLRKHEKTTGHIIAVASGGKKKKTFFCGLCNYSTDLKSNFAIHEKSAKHLTKTQVPDASEEFFCSLCDVHSRDSANFSRHLKTKRHRQLFDISLDNKPEKFEHLVNDLFCYLKTQKVPFEERKETTGLVLTPKNVPSYMGDSEKFLLWMKNSLESLNHRFSEKDGVCSFIWPTHRYKLSNKDFAFLVLSLTSKIFNDRVDRTKKEVIKYNENVQQCEKHKLLPIVSCETCIFPAKLGATKESLDSVTQRFSFWLRSAGQDREVCEAYWKWWKEGEEFEKTQSEVFAEEIGVDNTDFLRDNAETMNEDEFFDVISSFSCFCKNTSFKKDGTVAALSFLRTVGEHVKKEIQEEADAVKKQGKQLFSVSFFARANIVRENIFLSHFGFEKRTRFSTSVVKQTQSLWRTLL
ncbi:hypothetical protein LAU_0415 [Lausannevirus]|uniref:C2H2-type domain-containing protein n=1 Tax=Lausannevirus TaxID=999883 RepID=F2WLZ2_9VIRU|nr:hypothetical protein LAU_0415 [Lausannevirus]AEA07265.1 hypothetical protein LAU_0415 [Lausannevirus]